MRDCQLGHFGVDVGSGGERLIPTLEIVGFWRGSQVRSRLFGWPLYRQASMKLLLTDTSFSRAPNRVLVIPNVYDSAMHQIYEYNKFGMHPTPWLR